MDQLVRRLESVNNTISRVINFWVNNILEGYIIEIIVDTINHIVKLRGIFFEVPEVYT